MRLHSHITTAVLLAWASVAKADVGWRASFEAAKAEAASSHKPLFVEFTVPGCVACARLERETYPDASVTSLLGGFVPVKIDFTADEKLAAQYEVSSSPDLFVMTADGVVLNRVSRFVSPADLATFLEAGLQAPELITKKHIPWRVSYAQAEAEAKKLNRPVLVYVWNYG